MREERVEPGHCAYILVRQQCLFAGIGFAS